MQRSDWDKTPYARSDARDPDSAIASLLDKYQIGERQWTEHNGIGGLPACSLCFVLKGKTYRITVGVLDCREVDIAQRKKQVKRVIFWTLKPLLENAVVFGPDGMRKLLLPFMVDGSGATVYDRIQPMIENVTAKALINYGKQMALPAPEDTR